MRPALRGRRQQAEQTTLGKEDAMHQDDAPGQELDALFDALFDLVATEPDTAFDGGSSWVVAQDPGCDLDSQY
jgi:hypothetical protein